MILVGYLVYTQKLGWFLCFILSQVRLRMALNISMFAIAIFNVLSSDI